MSDKFVESTIGTCEVKKSPAMAEPDNQKVKVLLFAKLGCLLMILSGCMANGVSTVIPRADIESQFRNQLGIRLDPALQIQTNNQQFNKGQLVTFFVQNHETIPIYFEDQSLGLRAYKYDGKAQIWKRLGILEHPIESKETIVYPNALGNRPSFYSVSAGAFQSAGMVRLAVVGWENPTQPDTSRVAAYVDIEIQDENPAYFGTWLIEGNTRKGQPAGDKNFISFSFVGHKVTLRMLIGPDMGAMRVEIDEKLSKTFCNYSSTNSPKSLTFERLDDKTHIIKIFPITDPQCNNGRGYTAIVDFLPELP